jgi:hypothetical protein
VIIEYQPNRPQKETKMKRWNRNNKDDDEGGKHYLSDQDM